MREEEPLSHQQSWSLIEQMISAAKNEHQERGEGWLIWGWLLFGASSLSAIFAFTGGVRYIGWVWTAMLPVGLAVYFTFHFRSRRKGGVKTYVQELLEKFGTGFFISLFVMIAAAYVSGSPGTFGYYYILYAFWMFIHGSALRFRPLIVGAVVNWIAALAILIGYLIPGYMLRNQYKMKTKEG